MNGLKSIAQKVDSLIEPLRNIANNFGAPVLDFAMRLYVANVFWKSGTLRFSDWMNGNWSNQIFLFELEHPVPGLSPNIAAYGATIGELILPILLVLGLFGRVGAAGIIIMTAVIELTYIHATDHILWAFLAAAILIRGPGKISLDNLIMKFIRKDA